MQQLLPVDFGRNFHDKRSSRLRIVIERHTNGTSVMTVVLADDLLTMKFP